MILFNARSIRNKMLEFRALVATEEVEIIAVTESWIDVSSRDYEGEYDLPGYTMYRKDRVGRMGGGVLLYVRSHLLTKLRKIDTNFEILCVSFEGLDFQIILVYRPPHSVLGYDQELYNLLTETMRRKQTVLLGDFNCHCNWNNRGNNEGECGRLIEFANDNFLEQLVREPTRGNHILDLILVTDEDMVDNITVEDCLANSDHNTVRGRIRVGTNVEDRTVRRKLNFRRANFHRFRRDLSNLSLPEIDDVEVMWNTLKTRFLEIQASCIPYMNIVGTSKVKPKWFTEEIGSAIAERKRVYEQVKSQPTFVGQRRLTSLRRQVKRLVRVAKRDEERRVALATKTNPKEFFAYVNSRKPVRAKVGPLTDATGRQIVENGEIAEELNRFFTSVFTVERGGDIPRPDKWYVGQHPLDTIVCSADEIAQKISQLKAHKSAGPDGYLPKVVKKVAVELIPHLLVVFNESLRQAKAPSDTKIANVTPIYKKGGTEQAGNYRPISLTSIVGKLLESVITDRIRDHLETNDLLGDEQHGFRRGRSCLTNLLQFFHHMLTVYDESRAIDVVYLDFKKAFDKVPHRRLMAKVRALGIVGSVANWIEDWLTDRSQRVVVNGSSSEWAPVASGVPQGSVLGPVLFLIYINDLDVGIISKISMFADDTKLGTSVADSDRVRDLQRDLDRIGEWSDTWAMPFNTDKCRVMHIGRTNAQNRYEMLGQQIQPSNVEKDLGVLISSDLKSTVQCLEVEKRCHKILGYINRQFRYRDKQTVLTLYNSLVRPLLEYAVQFWTPTLRQDIQRLERVQARATKLVPEIRNKGYQRRLDDLNLFSLETRRLRGQLIETFKIMKGINKIDRAKLFTLSENPTRNHGWKVELKRFRTKPCGDLMTYRICNVWNNLPAAVVQSDTVDTFKKRLDRILPELHY